MAFGPSRYRAWVVGHSPHVCFLGSDWKALGGLCGAVWRLLGGPQTSGPPSGLSLGAVLGSSR
eukprot:4074334-Pyramimonas_sp.AAC.1